MSNSTQATSNTNKVAPTAFKPAAKPNAKDTGVDFNALFADAMGQSTPKAQLSTFETKMREALGKSDQKKPREPDSNPMAGESAQSMVWAQRNWSAEQTPNKQLESSAAVSGTKTPERPQVQESSSEPIAKQSAEEQTPSKPTPVAQNNTATEATTPTADTQAPLTTATAGSKAPVSTSAAVGLETTTMPLAQAPLAPQDQTAGPIADVSVNLQQSALLQNGATTTAAGPDIQDSTAQQSNTGKADISLSVSQQPNVQDNKASNSANPNNTPTANAQQVLSQISQQRAAVMGNSDGELDIQGIKAGDQKLATSNVGNPIAGLATTLGNGPKAAAQTLIKTPVNQPGFAKELGQTVNWALGRGMSTVDIRVNPESFGPMNMRLIQKGQQVQLIIRTQDEASANLMTQAIAGLKETMAQSGLNLQQVQVQHNPTANSSAGNPAQQFAQGSGNEHKPGSDSGSRPGHQGQHGTEQGHDTNPIAPAAKPNTRAGGIDLFA